MMLGESQFILPSLLEKSDSYPRAYALFWIFTLVFYFILSKMFLAVMIQSWRVHREEVQ